MIGLGYVGLPLALLFEESGFPVTGFDVDAGEARGARARRVVHPPHRQGARGAGLRARPDRGHHGFRPARRVRRDPGLRADAARPPPRARPLVRAEDRRGDREAAAARPAGRARVDHLSRHHARGALAALRGARASRAARTSSSPSRPSARTPATAASTPRRSPRWWAGSTRRRSRSRWRSTRGDPDGGAGLLARGRRGRQDPRERVPRRQHRARQRDEAGARPDGHQRLGGDRGGEDQAVRLHAVLPGPRARRPLHPARPLLPDLEGGRARRLGALHRARRRDQHLDARSTSSSAPRARSTATRAASRARRCWCWA